MEEEKIYNLKNGSLTQKTISTVYLLTSSMFIYLRLH